MTHKYCKVRLFLFNIARLDVFRGVTEAFFVLPVGHPN